MTMKNGDMPAMPVDRCYSGAVEACIQVFFWSDKARNDGDGGDAGASCGSILKHSTAIFCGEYGNHVR